MQPGTIAGSHFLEFGAQNVQGDFSVWILVMNIGFLTIELVPLAEWFSG
jgi:hypothetical protein